jgi:ABC-type uncharacterized transport system permease subunit
MILSTLDAGPLATLAPGGSGLLVAVALGLYMLALLPVAVRAPWVQRISAAALPGAWLLHGVLLAIDIGGIGQDMAGARLGFAPVLSVTVWLVIAVHTIEGRFVPLPAVRRWLALAGLLAVALTFEFPGETRPLTSPLAPLHFVLGVGAYGLFGAAVLHAVMLDAAERRLRAGGALNAASGRAMGMPLLQLERLTFRFVEAGFAVLTAAVVLGIVTSVAEAARWRWDHKTVLSLLSWAVFAALLLGRRIRGWRGHRATRWLYGGATLLLLAYAGSRFVFEVLLGRAPT